MGWRDGDARFVPKPGQGSTSGSGKIEPSDTFGFRIERVIIDEWGEARWTAQDMLRGKLHEEQGDA